MDWLDQNEVSILAPSLVRDLQPQFISVVADTARLRREIPVQPRLVPPDEGPPAAMHRWHVRLGPRLVEIECEATSESSSAAVNLCTGFQEPPDPLGDWAVLLDLLQLPPSIYVTRPLGIESRATDPTNVVYRPDQQGWKTAVYKAASRAEAEELLQFLRQDPWNDACFVGEPTPRGRWVTLQAGVEVGGYGGEELNQALKFACEWSLRYRSYIYQVKDALGLCPRVFDIYQGRVMQPADRY